MLEIEIINLRISKEVENERGIKMYAFLSYKPKAEFLKNYYGTAEIKIKLFGYEEKWIKTYEWYVANNNLLEKEKDYIKESVNLELEKFFGSIEEELKTVLNYMKNEEYNNLDKLKSISEDFNRIKYEKKQNELSFFYHFNKNNKKLFFENIFLNEKEINIDIEKSEIKPDIIDNPDNKVFRLKYLFLKGEL